MSGFKVEFDAKGALAGLALARAVTRRVVPRATGKSAALTQTQVRANASTGTHRPRLNHIPGTGPGPNVATGAYRRSITVTLVSVPGVAVAEVSTNAVQAWRLEKGFIGADSLGRIYRQPAYPHWAPAEAQVAVAVEKFHQLAAEEIEAAFDGKPSAD